jgi:hypothetical protein
MSSNQSSARDTETWKDWTILRNTTLNIYDDKAKAQGNGSLFETTKGKLYNFFRSRKCSVITDLSISRDSTTIPI